MATGFVWNERYMWHETSSAAGFVPFCGVATLDAVVKGPLVLLESRA